MPSPMSSTSMYSPAASPPPARPITFLDPPRNSPIIPDRTASRPNRCFNCNQEGHWFRDCPLGRSPPIPAAVAAAGAPPPLKCHCGGVCLVLTSHTEKNPGRQFYKCPVLPKEKKCKFFKWCDEVIAGQINGAGSLGKWQQRNDVNSPKKQAESSSPMCSCGAGRARILTMEKGEYYGRQYYGCHIKKGQGACNFFQWRKEEAPEGMGESKVPLFIVAPEEPNAQVLTNGVGQTRRPERKTSDVSFVPESPLPSSMDHRRYHELKHAGDQFSPIRKLSLDESSPSSIAATPRICFKCGKRAYWMSKCGHCFKCDVAETIATGVGEMDDEDAEEWTVPDISVVPESPLSHIDNDQGHRPNHHGQDDQPMFIVHGFSPNKMLNIDESSSKGLKCGKDGHWMSECQPCLKCGKIGHRMSDCTAYTVWW